MFWTTAAVSCCAAALGSVKKEKNAKKNNAFLI
jgi:hypothetical protein